MVLHVPLTHMLGYPSDWPEMDGGSNLQAAQGCLQTVHPCHRHLLRSGPMSRNICGSFLCTRPRELLWSGTEEQA